MQLNTSEQDGHVILEQAVTVPGYDPSIDVGSGETRRALLKVDICILPFIVLCFCFLQFDRTNIGNALTDTLREDIEIDNSDINLAQTLFTVGFVMTELPFNMISKYMGPERFLPITMFLWGIATWAQMFLKNAAGLCAARFFVGVLEGGYIPGFALYISKYYANNELALRYAIFWASNSFAGALGGPLSIGLLSLRGKGGLGGWQWLFLIGELPHELSHVNFRTLTSPKGRSHLFLGRGCSFRIFNDREAAILVTRVIRNDPTKALRYGQPVLPSHILETFIDWRLYGHLVAALLSMVMIAPMNTYAPSIIKSLGFTALQANGLNSVGSVCALIWSVTLAFSSDRFGERGFHIALGYLWGAAGLLWLALAPGNVSKWTLYGGVVWTQMGMGCAQAISAAWLTAKMPDYKRPIALAAYVMSIQLAGFPGNQLFRAQEYPNGHGRSLSPVERLQRPDSVVAPDSLSQRPSVDDRLERLERTVGALVDRLDTRLDELAGASSDVPRQFRSSEPSTAPDLDPAPVFLIRDAAADAGVHSPKHSAYPALQSDVISTGLVSLSTAHSLLALFYLYYGRWVRFPEDVSTDVLLLQVKGSPLLLCSILLIAVRHTTQELADRLAPRLFEEAKRLLTSSLLQVPQSIDFFQTVLVLSLWSTTIGQVPLSIDSWLLTGYAIQQALASPHFAEISRPSSGLSTSRSDPDSWCLWNHLCVAHLQYCVGTRRQALLDQRQVDRCIQFAKLDFVNNYEARMAAEVGLYWIIYNKCGGAQLDLADAKLSLRHWQQEWTSLFNEPRSQLLQMGFHFAHLLAYCQSLKLPKSVMRNSILDEMIRLSKAIINLAIDTADERSRHLTDHIYHIVTFSALTLCRIVHTYEPKLKASQYDISGLDSLVYKLVKWLRSVGLPCHAARILADIVWARFTKLRPGFCAPTHSSLAANDAVVFTSQGLSISPAVSFLYPSFIGSDLFSMDGDIESWPEWAPLQSDAGTSG
ncbi:hypothetical protein ACJZ2D_008900 [Fusarium nematophilum]